MPTVTVMCKCVEKISNYKSDLREREREREKERERERERGGGGEEKINKLFAGLGLVYIMKKRRKFCQDLGSTF